MKIMVICMTRHNNSSNAQMVLKLEMFISLEDILEVLMCSNQGSGNQLLIAQVAGHFKIQKLCAESLDIMVSNLQLYITFHGYLNA